MIFESVYSTNNRPHNTKDLEERKKRERKRNILLLILQYLYNEGFNESAQLLETESKIPNNFSVCDNIDLETILQDFESYYFVRLHKYPSITKKIDIPIGETKKKCNKTTTNIVKPSTNIKKNIKDENINKNENLNITLQGVSSFNQLENPTEVKHFNEENDKLWKSLECFEGYNNEWKSFAEIIAKEVIEENLNVKWNDVIGLDSAKNLLKEAIIYPLKYPEFFKSLLLTPWKGLLLYGPPGTGKTLLAKAVATECKTTFFNISASSIVSKWRGDSEKLVRVMFELARHQAPSTIFIDELDAIASGRDRPNEHEASRRLKSELLVQLDGLLQGNEQVFFLTTSNLPWDLDSAILRRLEKRILVDLPNENDRIKMLKTFLPKQISLKPQINAEITYDMLGQCFDGYSGADIKLVCKEAIMSSLRPVFCVLEEDKKHQYKGTQLDQINIKPIIDQHVKLAIDKTKPTTSKHLLRYKTWEAEYGSV